MAEGDANPVWHQSNAGGTWSFAQVSTDPFDRYPDVAVDASGKAHIVYSQRGSVWYVTNRTGSWVRTSIAKASDEDVYLPGEARPKVAVDGAGKAHIVYRRVGTGAGTYYVTNRTGAWVSTRITRSGADASPSIALDAAGHVYVAVARQYWAATPGLYFVTNRSGSWVTSIVPVGGDVVRVAVAVGAGGMVRIVYELDGAGLRTLDETGAAALPISSDTVRPAESGPARVIAPSGGGAHAAGGAAGGN